MSGTEVSPVPHRARRWFAAVVSLLGMASAISLLIFLWGDYERAPTMRMVEDAIIVIEAILMLGLCLLIVWRAGEQLGNVALATAFAFAFTADVVTLLLERRPIVWPGLALAISGGLFFLGATFYIRATQLFPKAITPAELEASPTIWGKVKWLRPMLKTLLRPPVAWLVGGCLSLLSVMFGSLDYPEAAEAVRVMIVGIGLVYFYVSYRSSDQDARRKVLWFLEAVVAVFIFSVIAAGIRAVLGAEPSLLRSIISLIWVAAYSLILLTCVVAAVFYAGAVSPALVVRRTMVYGVTIALLLFAFATVEAFIAEQLVASLGVTDHFASAFLGALFGLAFRPLKTRLERLLRRLANRTTTTAGSLPVPERKVQA